MIGLELLGKHLIGLDHAAVSSPISTWKCQLCSSAGHAAREYRL